MTKIQVVFGRVDVAKLDPRTRTYTYAAPDHVKVGYVVEVPGNAINAHPQEATIVALTSTYVGPVKPITRIVVAK